MGKVDVFAEVIDVAIHLFHQSSRLLFIFLYFFRLAHIISEKVVLVLAVSC